MEKKKKNFKKKNIIGRLTLLDFKIFEAAVIKTVWYWCQDRQINHILGVNTHN